MDLKTKETNIPRMNQMLDPQIIEYDKSKMTSVIAFVTKDWQRNTKGEIHGGVISAIFDTAMGYTAAYMSGKTEISTTDLSISYIRPMSKEDMLIVYSKVQKMGRTLIRVTAEGFSKNTDKIVATSQATFLNHIIQE